MRKLLPILLIILFLSSCTIPSTESVNVDGSKVTSSHSTGKFLYVVNTNSKTFHISSCKFAADIKEENKHITSDLDFLASREFTPCRNCINGDN